MLDRWIFTRAARLPSLLLVVIACASVTLRADDVVTRVVMLPMSDRTTIVVELKNAVDRVEEIPGDASSVIVEAGPVSAAVQPQDLTPSRSSNHVSGVTLTGITRSDGTTYLRVRLGIRGAFDHHLRSQGSRIYVDIAPRPVVFPAPPAPAAPPIPDPQVSHGSPDGRDTKPVPAASKGPTATADPAAGAEAAYQALESTILQRARELAAKPDVKGLLRLRGEIEKSDKDLGRRRPEIVERLQNELLRYTDEARVRQLERDRESFLKK